MTMEEAIRILDEVIPPPEHHTVDLDHLQIAQAWLYIKEALTAEPFNCSLEEFGECSYRRTGCSDCEVKEKIRNAIDKAEPVKHAQWLSIKVMDDEADFGETDGAECSACGYTTNNEYWAKTYYHYCPNCGADMRGGENG